MYNNIIIFGTLYKHDSYGKRSVSMRNFSNHCLSLQYIISSNVRSSSRKHKTRVLEFFYR